MDLIKDLWLQMDGIWFPGLGPYVDYPYHFKSNEDIITKFKWHELQIITINKKKFDGSGITPSYFPTLMKMVILAIFQIQSSRIEQTTTLLFMSKVLWCSNYLMQKKNFYNPFYLLKYFSNFALTF